MNAEEYMTFVEETAQMARVDSNYFLIGLAGEVGELLNVHKKRLRGDPSEDLEERMVSELGDVFWYLWATCRSLNVTPEEVITKNVAKLRDRRARGVLKGSGDNR